MVPIVPTVLQPNSGLASSRKGFLISSVYVDLHPHSPTCRCDLLPSFPTNLITVYKCLLMGFCLTVSSLRVGPRLSAFAFPVCEAQKESVEHWVWRRENE